MTTKRLLCSQYAVSALLTVSFLALIVGVPVTAGARQDGAAPPPTVTTTAAKKVELPEGDGKPIATEFCQDCHRLSNLTRARKTADEWKDTVGLMLDRGARLPPEKVDALVAYLAKNFNPDTPAAATTTTSSQGAGSGSGSNAATPTVPSPAAEPQVPTPPAAAAQAKKVDLPEGDGKPIATEYCQECHEIINVTKAAKSADEWHDTVLLMIDRGARIPQDKIDTLVKYLTKNYGPKAPTPPAATSPTAADKDKDNDNHKSKTK